MRNYTPHKLVFYPADTPNTIGPGSGVYTPLFELPSEPIPARLVDEPLRIEEHSRMPVQVVRPSVADLPEKYAEGIVSQLYAREV